MVDPDVVNLVSNGGLAAACIYAARYLAQRLEKVQCQLFETLTSTVAEATATMRATEQTMHEVRDAMIECPRPERRPPGDLEPRP